MITADPARIVDDTLLRALLDAEREIELEVTLALVKRSGRPDVVNFGRGSEVLRLLEPLRPLEPLWLCELVVFPAEPLLVGEVVLGCVEIVLDCVSAVLETVLAVFDAKVVLVKLEAVAFISIMGN
jgi:hypothetical protein